MGPAGLMSPGVRPQFQRPPAAGTFIAGQTRPIAENPPPPPPRVPPFNAPILQPPPLPPDNITTEKDRQIAVEYENWLNHQNQVLQQQLKYYESEVQKLRKVRKVGKISIQLVLIHSSLDRHKNILFLL